jgi:predicted acylesterase/phospholipase RssA
MQLPWGGNRCWWQAGVLNRLFQQRWQLPPFLVGTSAGAAVAASCLTDGPKAALSACIRLYSQNTNLFDWRALMRFRFQFAHQTIYPAWVASFLNQNNFEVMRSTTSRLRVAFTRPARCLGLTGSIVVGTLAYTVDKHVWHSIHPRLPRQLGLRQDFLDMHECKSVEEAQALLVAAAAAPPFLRSRKIVNGYAIDGGYVDNAPTPPQTEEEKARTLVLLTRHYPDFPLLFDWHGRIYLQPSQRVPVSTWDCRKDTHVMGAFALGERDAAMLL